MGIPIPGWTSSPECVVIRPSGVPQIDALAGGLPVGGVIEIIGGASSGRTTLGLALAGEATRSGRVSAWVDASDSLDVASAIAAGVELRRLIWVRCRGRLENAMKAADLLLHGGGLGLVVLDIADVPARQLNRIPLSYWHRFRCAVENTPAALVVLAGTPQARNCSALALELRRGRVEWLGSHAGFRLLESVDFEIVSRKPVRPAPVPLRARAIG